MAAMLCDADADVDMAAMFCCRCCFRRDRARDNVAVGVVAILALVGVPVPVPVLVADCLLYSSKDVLIKRDSDDRERGEGGFNANEGRVPISSTERESNVLFSSEVS